MLVKLCLVYYGASEKSSVTEVDLNGISGGRGQGRGIDGCCGGTRDTWKSLYSVCTEQDQIDKVLMDYSGCCIDKAL